MKMAFAKAWEKIKNYAFASIKEERGETTKKASSAAQNA